MHFACPCPISHQAPVKLPPVSRVASRPRTQQKPFLPVTPADIKSRQRSNDLTVTAPLILDNHKPGETLKSLPLSYALPEDAESAFDTVAAQQVRVGDRVLVRRKRMRESNSIYFHKFVKCLDNALVVFQS